MRRCMWEGGSDSPAGSDLSGCSSGSAFLRISGGSRLGGSQLLADHKFQQRRNPQSYRQQSDQTGGMAVPLQVHSRQGQEVPCSSMSGQSRVEGHVERLLHSI
jgi:hypothetical protein